MPQAIVVFTAKSAETLLMEGGTSAWRLDRNHARQCEFVVCTRNAYADWVEGAEAHHSAFLIGRISGVVPVPDRDNRYLIEFSEYARVNIPDVWSGDRNPVKYVEVDDLGIDFGSLTWEAMPEPAEPVEAQVSLTAGSALLTLAEAKRGIALAYNIPQEAVEITIRW